MCWRYRGYSENYTDILASETLQLNTENSCFDRKKGPFHCERFVLIGEV